MFFNKTPKIVNINKLDTFLVDCMTNTGLNEIDCIMINGLIRDNPTTIYFLVRTSNEINIWLAKTLPNLIFYITYSLGLTGDGCCLHDKGKIFTIMQFIKFPANN